MWRRAAHSDLAEQKQNGEAERGVLATEPVVHCWCIGQPIPVLKRQILYEWRSVLALLLSKVPLKTSCPSKSAPNWREFTKQFILWMRRLRSRKSNRWRLEMRTTRTLQMHAYSSSSRKLLCGPCVIAGLGLVFLSAALFAVPASAGLWGAFPKKCRSLIAVATQEKTNVEIGVTTLASDGTQRVREVQDAAMLPRGSAVLTSAGGLSDQGILHLIHAATGSMTREGGAFEPTIESVALSIKNSVKLAELFGHKRIAIPFIGGKVFVDRIGVPPEQLAEAIVHSAVKSREKIEIRFVTFGSEDTKLFQRVVGRLTPPDLLSSVAVVSGSIVDFSLHGASVIVNAANMEVRFGGGLSEVIARATGNPVAIEREAADLIADFYRAR